MKTAIRVNRTAEIMMVLLVAMCSVIRNTW